MNAVPPLPYKIAVLCYLYDDAGHVLMLHRSRQPNAGMYSPIGGKLEVTLGEGPHECAVREIWEEAGLRLTTADVRLTGIVSEKAYEGQTHWLIFLFEVLRPVHRDEVHTMDFEEGKLEWVEVSRVHELAIPETDAKFMWPLVKEHRGGGLSAVSGQRSADGREPRADRPATSGGGGFFMVHIDCTVQPMTWTVTESKKG